MGSRGGSEGRDAAAAAAAAARVLRLRPLGPSAPSCDPPPPPLVPPVLLGLPSSLAPSLAAGPCCADVVVAPPPGSAERVPARAAAPELVPASCLSATWAPPGAGVGVGVTDLRTAVVAAAGSPPLGLSGRIL